MPDPLNPDAAAAPSVPASPAATATPAAPAAPAIDLNALLDDDSPLGSSINTPAAPAAPAPAAPANPNPTPGQSGPGGATEGSTPSAPGGPTPPAAAATAAAVAAKNAREWAAQQLGYTAATEFNDDASFVQSLIAGNQTGQQYRARVQELENQHAILLSRLGQPAAPAAPAAADPMAAYKGPEFDPRWLNMVEQTPEGQLRAKAGVDPTIPGKVLAAQQWRRDLFERFSADPRAFLDPLVEARSKTLVDEAIEKRFADQQARQYQESFLSQNEGWLFAKDQAGKPVLNAQTGGRIFSPEGQKFYGYLKEATDSGITNPQAQERYARALLTRDLALPHLQTKTATETGEAAKQKLLEEQNRRVASPSGSTAGADGVTPAATQNASLNLRERLQAAFATHGVKDSDLEGDF